MQWQEFRTHLRHIQARELKRVERAFTLGQRLHDGQKRKSGEPYFHHPIAVANMLADMHADADTVIAALLHDTVEDTPITLEEIDEKFDGAVARLINGLTKLKTKDVAMRPTLDENIETLRKIFSLMQEDVRIMVIKLVDRLHNMQTVEFLSPERQKTFAQETYDVFVKIADRLCMQDLRDELEALCLAILDHEKYTQLAELRAGNEFRATPVIDDVRKKLQSDHVRLAAKTSLHFEHKNWHQLGAQLLTEGSVATGITMLTIVFECVDIDQCYQILGWLHQSWKREVLSFEDFINAPQLNGYRGLHTTIITSDGTRVRCKIRTREMQEYARKGVATVCFTGKTQFADILPWTQHLSPLTTDTEGSSNDFWQSLKNDILGESILIHGPDDRTVQLPKGSTALDAAFFLFEDEALKMKKIRVNGSEEYFNTALHNASSIDIEKSDTMECSLAWLKFARSGLAAASIRRALFHQSIDVKLDIGRAELQREFTEQRKGFIEELNENALIQSLHLLDCHSFHELYIAIAEGRITSERAFEVIFQKKTVHIPRVSSYVLQYKLNSDNNRAMEKVGEAVQLHDASIRNITSKRKKNLHIVSISARLSRQNADFFRKELITAGAEEVQVHMSVHYWNFLLIALLVLLWGIDPVFSKKILLQGMNPYLFSFIRSWSVLIFSFVLFLYSIRREKIFLRIPLFSSGPWLAGIALFFVNVFTYLFLVNGSPTFYNAFLRLNPILIALPLIVQRRYRLSIAVIIFLIAVAVGVITMGNFSFLDYVFIIIIIAAFNIYTVTANKFQREEKVQARYSQLFLYISFVSALFSSVLLFTDLGTFSYHPLEIIAVALYSILFVGFPYAIFHSITEEVGYATLSPWITTTLIVTIASEYFVLHSTLNFLYLLPGALLLSVAGLYASFIRRLSETKLN